MQNQVVSPQDWRKARLDLLAAEKAFTQEREALAARRRALPWVRVEKDYRFQRADGEATMAQMFDGRSQLVIYHFMLGPDWEEGCKSCSFWADNFDHIPVHLAHRDITFTAVSRAPLGRIEAYKRRMGWSFPWASSHGGDFNFDHQVSFTPEQLAGGGGEYNYAPRAPKVSELPGVSVFYRNDEDEVFHTYSAYARGIDALNGAYQYIDLTPKGRDEAGLTHTMEWVRRRDQY